MDHQLRKILLVEDDFFQYQRLHNFLTTKGYRILGHTNGQQVDSYEDAIAIATSSPPDLAILDLKLNGNKDGLDIAAFLRRHFTCRIIILTAEGNEENQRRSLLAADGFVLKMGKPINLEQLGIEIFRNLNKTAPKNENNSHSRGDYLLVTEVLAKDINKKNINTDISKGKVETLILWEVISYISADNEQQNNTVLIHFRSGKKAYRCHITLQKMMERLPDTFAQFNKSEIVNLEYLDKKKPGDTSYFIENEEFLLNDKYKPEALKRIRTALGWN